MKMGIEKILILSVCCLFSCIQAFKEEAPSKWSPSYLGRYASYPSYSSGAGHSRYKTAYPSQSDYSGYRTYRPSWFVGEDASSMYKRGPKYLRSTDESCVTEGEICIYRGGLVGAVMKLSCCEGTTCQFLGRSFVCVEDSDEVEEEEDYFNKDEMRPRRPSMNQYQSFF